MSEENTGQLQIHTEVGELKENIFEQIVEHFPDIIHSVDANGTIVSTNAFASDLLGYTQEELIGKSVYDIYPPDIKKSVSKGFEELKKEGFKDRIESKLISKSGEIIDVEIRSLSLYNKSGEFIRTFSIIRDMREINFLKEQLVQQGKLAALGELAAGIMHDIRNPLTVINSYNNTFLKGAIDDGDKELMRTCQTAIEKASERIQRLTDHMRSFTRTEKDPMEEINLAELISDCLLMLETKIKITGAILENSIEKKDIRFIGYPNRIEQVLINLISNACDAVEGSMSRLVSIDASVQKSNISITVSDTGHGVSEKNKPKIFESFFTTKPKGQGTGLGLSLSQGIIYEMGGAITLESEEGNGAKFTVSLPRR